MSEHDAQHSTNQPEEASESHGSLMSLMGGSGDQGPLGVGEIEGEGEAKDHNHLLNNSVMIAGIALVVLVVGLLVLRQFQAGNLADGGVSPKLTAKVEQYLGTPEGASAEGQNVGKAGAEKSGGAGPMMIRNLLRDTDTIVSMFSRDLSKQQVSVEYIKKNPFRMPTQEKPKKDKDADQDKAAMQRKERLKTLRKKADDLALQSVMGGAQPVAVIGGELRQVGDQVGPFTIQAINRLRVKLKAAGETFTIDMENDSSDRR